MLDLGSKKAAQPFDQEDHLTLHNVLSNLKYLHEKTTDERIRSYCAFALKALQLVSEGLK